MEFKRPIILENVLYIDSLQDTANGLKLSLDISSLPLPHLADGDLGSALWDDTGRFVTMIDPFLL